MGSDRKRFSCFTKYRVYGQYWSQLTRNIYFPFDPLLGEEREVLHQFFLPEPGDAPRGHPPARARRALGLYNVAPGTEVQVIPGRYDDEEAKAIKKSWSAPRCLARAPTWRRAASR